MRSHFKQLETDVSILEKKALAAIEAYSVDMVVANELATNRTRVHVYKRGQPGFKVIEAQDNLEEALIKYIAQQ